MNSALWQQSCNSAHSIFQKWSHFFERMMVLLVRSLNTLKLFDYTFKIKHRTGCFQKSFEVTLSIWNNVSSIWTTVPPNTFQHISLKETVAYVLHIGGIQKCEDSTETINSGKRMYSNFLCLYRCRTSPLAGAVPGKKLLNYKKKQDQFDCLLRSGAYDRGRLVLFGKTFSL